MSEERHVTPVDDNVEHAIAEDCVCGPTATFAQGGVVYTHHSLDGREQHE
jgi:hypothetical protein